MGTYRDTYNMFVCVIYEKHIKTIRLFRAEGNAKAYGQKQQKERKEVGPTEGIP